MGFPGRDALRESRRRLGLSQRALAKLAEVPQSTISEIEAGRRQPTIPLLGRIFDRIGRPVELVAMSDPRFSARRTAESVRAALHAGGSLPTLRREDAALRAIIDLRDAVLAADRKDTIELVAERPGLVGDRRFDALLAAVVEDSCARRGAPPPSWTGEAERFVRPFWYLSPVPRLRWWEFSMAPGAFLRHGVLAAELELTSV